MKHLVALVAPAILLALTILSAQARADTGTLTYCKLTEGQPSGFANCTQAQCQPIAPNQTTTVCSCNVQPGPSHPQPEASVSWNVCKPLKGTYIQSRYAPVVAYQVCPNTKVWANCLGSPCTLDPQDKTKANCTCPVTAQKDFVIVLPTSDCSTARCQDNTIYSSATALGATQMTTLLKDKKFPDFQPPKICVAPGG